MAKKNWNFLSPNWLKIFLGIVLVVSGLHKKQEKVLKINTMYPLIPPLQENLSDFDLRFPMNRYTLGVQKMDTAGENGKNVETKNPIVK